MPWGSCPCPGVEMRGSPPLAPPLCVCGEIYLTFPYLYSSSRRATSYAAGGARPCSASRETASCCSCSLFSSSSCRFTSSSSLCGLAAASAPPSHALDPGSEIRFGRVLRGLGGGLALCRPESRLLEAESRLWQGRSMKCCFRSGYGIPTSRLISATSAPAPQ